MSKRSIYLDGVMTTLLSDSHDLRFLAEHSGFDPLTFYQGADLTSLDLRGQDLQGLNFDSADIRFSQLNDIKFDRGAFNRSSISSDQAWAVDHYDLSASDILNHDSSSIFVFVQFRKGFVDKLFEIIAIPYSQFSGQADVSTVAIRKARKGSTVAFQTAHSIIKRFSDIVSESSPSDLPFYDVPRLRGLLTQPMAVFMSGGINGEFRPVALGKMKSLLGFKRYIDEQRNFTSSEGDSKWYRETPEGLLWFRQYYKDYDWPDGANDI
ncbi:hypothetical protein [Sphingomonas faeni]|uniref:hypothetical protein n=1 Tax=Sphingomonas faeni TaxID=185950 RepID=UPI00335BA0AC